ncbi:MAG: dephospho-CoA kinase [SAR324 cluster bacterium]|nr:dephospho-CoA kinase [SAR324 cluster bacterium]MBL7035932.1 dephospho-CoA kinase [SAR324 cluster bacterium]
MNSQKTKPALIGLTGGIASGKSTVIQFLQKEGYSVIDADKLGHKVLEPGNPGYYKVLEKFGDKILNPDKTVNRLLLGAIVFGNPDKLKQLNGISHPIIAQLIHKEFDKLAADSVNGIVFLEAALLIEASWHKVCQYIWVVMLDPKVAVRRLQERDSLSEKDSQARLDAQLSPKARLAFADIVLHNDGLPEELITQTKQALQDLIVSRS